MKANETKHMPAPWAYDRINGRHCITAPRRVNKHMVSHVLAEAAFDSDESSGIHSDEARANAAFIVRAVNAHEELVGVIESMDYIIQQWRETGREPAYHQWLAYQDVCRAALAKTRGESR